MKHRPVQQPRVVFEKLVRSCWLCITSPSPDHFIRCWHSLLYHGTRRGRKRTTLLFKKSRGSFPGGASDQPLPLLLLHLSHISYSKLINGPIRAVARHCLLTSELTVHHILYVKRTGTVLSFATLLVYTYPLRCKR